MRFIVICLFLFLAFNLQSANETTQARNIAAAVNNGKIHLENDTSLVTLGNSSLENAKFIFLPEVHDDPDSLMVQLKLIAREREASKPFIILDESLPSMQKSIWDIFAAREMRKNGEKYVPQKFEAVLKKLANQFQRGPLELLQPERIWTLKYFRDKATPFYGWDLEEKSSLVDRNVQMTKTLKIAAANNARVIVMAGARHVPELEFLTSHNLFCQDSRFKDIKAYFSAIEQRFGAGPDLPYGVGATLPIYKFIINQPYVIVFNRNLYKELQRVVSQFQNNKGKTSCFRL